MCEIQISHMGKNNGNHDLCLQEIVILDKSEKKMCVVS